MKTENLVIILLFGGIFGFLGAIYFNAVRGSNPYNPGGLFFFVFLGIYLIISAIIIIFKIKGENNS